MPLIPISTVSNLTRLFLRQFVMFMHVYIAVMKIFVWNAFLDGLTLMARVFKTLFVILIIVNIALTKIVAKFVKKTMD